MPELLEAVTVMEEVAVAGETVVSVDLTTVSQQLDQIISLQMFNFVALGIIAGIIAGVVSACVVRGLWK